MKSIVIQWSAVIALLGILSMSRTVASEASESDDLYSESVYIERPSAELPSSIDDTRSPQEKNTHASRSSTRKKR